MVYEKWNQRNVSAEFMVLVTPSFHEAMKKEDSDSAVNDGVRGIHYLIVPEGSLQNEQGGHAHFKMMTTKDAIAQARQVW